MTKPTRVSVIVPTRDRPVLLRRALASIQHVGGPDLELEAIVADNGSDLVTRLVTDEFGARYVRTTIPGAAAARNAGLRVATGTYFAFLDDDDRWTREHVRPHLDLLTRRPELMAVVGQAVCTDEAGVATTGPWPVDLPRDGVMLNAFFDYWPQVGATVSRAAVLDSVGVFDEALIGSEDWDWHLRLALKHKVGFVPVPCVLFQQRNVGSFDKLQALRLSYSLRVFRMNLRRSDRRRPSPRFILRRYGEIRGFYYHYFVAGALERARRGEARNAWRAVAQALCISPLHLVVDLGRRGFAYQTMRTLLTSSRVAPASDS